MFGGWDVADTVLHQSEQNFKANPSPLTPSNSVQLHPTPIPSSYSKP